MSFEIFEIPAGDAFVLSETILKDEFGASVANLTGWQFAFKAKADIDVADALADIAFDSSNAAAIKVAGRKVSAILSPALLADLEPGVSYAFALKAKTPAGTVQTLRMGLLCRTKSAMEAFPMIGGGGSTSAVVDNDGTPLVDNDGTIVIENQP